MAIRVFIVDDHEVLRNGLRALLEREQDMLFVGESASGIDALRAVDEVTIDVLLLDVSMPGLSGARTAQGSASARPWPSSC